MIAGITRRALFLTASFALVAASNAASPLTFKTTYNLANALAVPFDNRFNPQGLGFDDAANELLFAQASRTNPFLVRTDLTGTILGTVKLGDGGDAPGSFAVSVAADKDNYYFSDYSLGRYGLSLYAQSKATGLNDPVFGGGMAFEGTPMDVRGGKLYRTNPSPGNAGHYDRLRSVRVANLADPNNPLQTLDLSLPYGVGIGDLSVDLADNALYVLGYNDPSGDLYRFDLTTGALTDTYDLDLDTLTAGIAVGKGSLYYYDWKDGSGSTLSVYSLQAVPEPASFAAFAVGALGLLRRRRR